MGLTLMFDEHCVPDACGKSNPMHTTTRVGFEPQTLHSRPLDPNANIKLITLPAANWRIQTDL